MTGSVSTSAARPEGPTKDAPTPLLRRLPALLIAAVVGLNAWLFRGDLTDVNFMNDATLHEQMVRFATTSLSRFHFPMTQWYPDLNLGSPQFLHYQGLGALATGFLGLVVGANTAFRIVFYLLMTLWPLVVYFSALTFRLPRYAALGAALSASLVSSSIGVGYEQKAYLWTGYGVWAQLCASMFLPFAWAWTYRALEDRRYLLRAVILISLTCALHFETGYAAIGGIVLLTPVVWSRLRTRVLTAAWLLAGALVGTLWITVPLLMNAKWAAINTSQSTTSFALGYGARKNLTWLVGGNYFDHLRWPVLTVFFFVGVVGVVATWRRRPEGRAVLVLFVALFVLSFGPTTLKSFVDVIPGHADIFFRRYMGPAQLAGLYLIGIGTHVAATSTLAAIGRFRHRVTRGVRPARFSVNTTVAGCLTGALLCAGLALPHAYSYATANDRTVHLEALREAADATSMGPILSFLREHHAGRVYAGNPYNWGRTFLFGQGPVYLYLADQDVDQISTEAWAASLMEEPQNNFNETNPSDYAIFGVRYLLLPSTRTPAVSAHLLLKHGPYALWELPGNGYFSVVTPSGLIRENKATIAQYASLMLNSAYFAHHVDMSVAFGGTSAVVSLPTLSLTSAPGRVLTDTVTLDEGFASAVVAMHHSGNLVLSASFDPGWRATVDGHPVPTRMLAPALVSVPVPRGVHTVVFTYRGYPYFPELLVLSGGGVLLLGRRSKRVAPTGWNPGHSFQPR